MKVVELLKIGGEMLKLMSKNEVNRDDWRFVKMYEELWHCSLKILFVTQTESLKWRLLALERSVT